MRVALINFFAGPIANLVSKVMKQNEFFSGGSASVVGVLGADVSESEARRVFSSVKIIQWERGPEVRGKIRRAFNPEFPAEDLVFLVPPGCSTEGALRTLRLISSVPELAESLRRGRTKLHVWRLGSNNTFRVFDPEKQDFVCPLATI